MANKTFNIEVTVEERWIPHLQSFLKHMEAMGDVGHSALVGFYADGDGDFRPTFNFDEESEWPDPIERADLIHIHKHDNDKIYTSLTLIPEVIFDAG